MITGSCALSTATLRFDAPGTGDGSGQGTFAEVINPAGAITGYYIDANNVFHGYLRTP
jgi:hypothetical protein